MLGEVYRVLEPGGRLLLHTSPNVYFMHLVLPSLIPLFALLGRRPLALKLLRQYRASWEYHAEHRACRADTPAATQVLERVEAEPDVQALTCEANGLHHELERGALLGEVRGEQHEAAEATRAGLAVEHLHPSGLTFLGDDARGLARAVACARQATGEVDRDDVSTGPRERLVAGQEVAHRRL